MLPGDSFEKALQRTAATIGAAIIGGQSEMDVEPPEPKLYVLKTSEKVWEASSVSDINSQSFKMLRQTVQQMFPGVATAPGMVLGATDSRHYREMADNTFRFVPIRLTSQDLPRIHGTDERISVENFAEIVRFYAQLIENTSGQSR